MEAYKDWVRRNKDFVFQLESLANALTWLLPERFSDSEIMPEAVTSIVGIFTTINQYIIETTPTRWPHPSPSSSSVPYSLWISALKEVETLAEVMAQQSLGDEKKWNVMAITEAAKVLLRLALFRDSGYKMLLQGGEILNTDSHTNPPDSGNRIGHHAMAGNGAVQAPGYLNHLNGFSPEGRALSALSRFGENARMTYDATCVNNSVLQRSALTASQMAKRHNLSSILSEKGLSGGLFLAGETLYILRPLIYVLFIRKYGIRSWIPWLGSLGVDLVAMIALAKATESKRGVKEETDIHVSVAENKELKRRKLLWALYLMRDPFFCKYTRQRIEGTQKLLEPVPILGLVAEKLGELVLRVQTRYTYMSAS
ncbi:Peroxisome biogenesis protein 16-like protein [Drosera capensis]